MSTALSAKKLLPTQRVLFTPLSTDVFVVEQHNVVQSPNDSIPAYGTAHDTISKLKSWPNHSFCLQTEPDDQGNYQRVYVADQDTQEQYNWEISDAPDWPTVTQTFVVPRSSYVYPDPTPEATYPPPPNVNTDITGYEITSIEEQRIGEPRLDSLYVAVKVTREKVSLTQTRAYIDLDTNTLQSEVTQKVAAGTVGTIVDASGNYRDVTPQNAFWSLSSTKKAQGLAGNSVNGVATRTWYYRDNYTWPRVLNYIHIQPVLADPGDIYSPAVDFSWQPVWLADAFDGPCNYTLVERWTLLRPIFGGDSDWTYGTAWATATAYVVGNQVNINGLTYRCLIDNTSDVFATDLAGGKWRLSYPDIPEETPMLKQEIYFLGTDLRIPLPACLHEAYQIWDTQFYGFYPATNPTRWPATILARVTVNPDQGGWLVRMFYVDAPDPSGTATGITLTQTAATTTGFTLTWAFEADVPAGTIKLNISTDPSFGGGFLTGYEDLTVTGLTTTVTTAVRGQVYYATISRGGITSNICVCLGEPEPELNITNGGVSVASGGSINVGSSEVGTLLNTVIVLNNDGIEQITGLSAGVAGADAAQFSLTTPTSTINAGSSQNLTIGFTPTSTGSKSTTLTIPSSDPDSPYTISLSGTGVQREINVKYSSTSYASGSNIEVGSVAAGTPSQFTLTIENTGTSSLTISSAPISGTDWTVVTAPTSPVAASGSTTMVVQLSTTTAGASVGTVTINSNDASEPAYVLYLVANVTATPVITVTSPWNGLMATGDTLNFGRMVLPNARPLVFTIGNSGYANLTGITVGGSGTGYSIGAASSTTVVPGGTATVTVTFDTAGTGATGTYPGTLTLTTDDPVTPVFTVNLTSIRVAAATSQTQLEEPEGTVLATGANTINFGNVLLSGGTQVENFVYRNLGSQTSGTLAGPISGSASADYTLGGLAASVVSTGASVGNDPFTVTFNPSDYGQRTATLTVTDTGDSPSVDFAVTLTGFGVPADAIVTGQSADVIVGQLDADDQGAVASQIVTPGGNHAAVSASGRLAVADANANRVLIWNTVPVASGTPADLVLGQANFTSSGSGLTSSTMNGPISVAWYGANLWVSDQLNSRILRFTNPVSNGQAASLVLGQANFTSGDINRGGAVAANTLGLPQHIMVSGTKLIVADTDNNRVLIWNTIPVANGEAATIAVGQANLTSNASGSTATTLSAPQGVTVLSDGRLAVGDTGNHRVLIYATTPASSGATASIVLGQTNFTNNTANRGGAVAANALSSPGGVAAPAAGGLAIADFGNNRVLLWYDTPGGSGEDAHGVIGQQLFTTSSASTSGAAVMSSPNGVAWSGTTLIVGGLNMRRNMIFSP